MDLSLLFPAQTPLLETLVRAKAAQGRGWVDQGLGGLGRNRGSLDHLWRSLLLRMIPKEQKGPVMTTTGDLTEAGKVDPAREPSSDPMLSCSQAAATQACWPQAWANRCEFEAGLWNLSPGLGSFPKHWEGPCSDARTPKS